MSTMTITQAIDQAVKLKRQGLTYKQIEEHLKSAGYVSSRTKQPVKEMAIRYMVSKVENLDQREKKKELEDEKIFVTQNEVSLKDSIKVLLALPQFSQEMKLRMVSALVEENPKNQKAAAPTSRLLQTQATA